jgi:hypothetical protein
MWVSMNTKKFSDSESIDRKVKNTLFAKSGEKWSFLALITVCLRFFHMQKIFSKHFWELSKHREYIPNLRIEIRKKWLEILENLFI